MDLAHQMAQMPHANTHDSITQREAADSASQRQMELADFHRSAQKEAMEDLQDSNKLFQ